MATEQDTKQETISTEIAVKHPLQNKWTLWYDKPERRVSQTNWADQIRKVATFDSVEEFWSLFNNIPSPSKLPFGSNLHLFKSHIEPKWEDQTNAQGGKWVYPVTKRPELDDLWLNIVLALIGDNFDHSEDVCGAVLSIRKNQDKISLWTKSARDEKTQIQNGKQLKAFLAPSTPSQISYQTHTDSLARDSSYNNPNKYTC
eukprot:TRINITY_DN65_c0_g1::TRINITY_DN65_c0_g1_i1::g.14744::m.14744 TRINITY_DN65_c0_g1::TRINITY_DN65_c0_g1_i1::g.14744  ORF type:complete len:230 (+),score=47.60,sp/Q55FE0/IF4E_DICDI/46.45/2e-52,IF4E/PF01652.13/8.9e-58 TRINITY_DN65_c0_g1_i1:89-691(+)